MRAFRYEVRLMNCKHEILKPGGYVGCSADLRGSDCVSAREHPQSECHCFEEGE